ncbi:MAG: hypothetical protein JRF33_26340 [Deltaproteobacteria bacterium]|nr:hypothetical protein [Deltaproteobacteria bacterium]
MQTEEENNESSTDNATSDLAAAWDASDSTDETAGEEALVEESGGWEGDDKPNEEPPAAADGEIAGGGDTGHGEEDFAPKSLSATAREAWRETPAAMKADIVKRERDFSAGIQKYAEGAKRAEGMDRVLQPYSQYLQMNGGAGQTINTLLQTGSGLQMGSPIQKAQIVADLIGQFGVDVQALDGLLSGNGAPPEMQQQNAVQQQVQAALQPYQQMMQHQQQQQQQQQQQAANVVSSELSTFSQAPEHEFYADVRMQMADIMDMAANRGQQVGLKEAYNTACQLNPEIKKIVDSRALAASAQSRRRAGSSIHGSPGGPGGGLAEGGMRSAIEDAWDSAGRA